MAKDKQKEIEYEIEGIRRAKERNKLRRKLAGAKFKERGKWRDAQKYGYFDY